MFQNQWMLRTSAKKPHSVRRNTPRTPLRPSRINAGGSGRASLPELTQLLHKGVTGVVAATGI
jgi:hypothetical protein